MHPELEALCRRHGVFLRREAAALGYQPRAFQQLLRGGSITRVRTGAYTLTFLWDAMTPAQRYATRCRAAARSARTGVVLSHVSSLALITDEWWGLPLDEVHLTRRDGRTGRRQAGVRQHAGAVLPGDTLIDGDLEYMNPTRTALEVATVVDFEPALVVINALLHAGHTTIEQLCHRSVDMYQWPGSLNQELLLRHADGRLASVGETRTYVALRRAGFPRPEPQVPVLGRHGEVLALMDFTISSLGIWIEFDGRVKYQRYLRDGETVTDAVLREKRREQMVARVTGLECARLDWRDLAHPARFERIIRDAAAVASARRRTG